MLARPLALTDLPAYIRFRGICAQSEALLDPADGLSEREPRLGGLVSVALNSAFDLALHRDLLVIRDGRSIDGLAAAFPRYGTDTWDVSQLMVWPEGDREICYQTLLAAICERAQAEGVERIYLRLREGSPAFVPARHAGLITYSTEHVCRREVTASHPSTDSRAETSLAFTIRARHPSDNHALFRMYSSTAPLSVRQVEALTLREWRWLDGWNSPASWPVRGHQRHDYVAIDRNGLAGWIRISPVSRRLEVLGVGPSEDAIRSLVAFGLDRLGGGRPTVAILRDYYGAALPVLEDCGFETIARNWLLARAFSLRAVDSAFVPVAAS